MPSLKEIKGRIASVNSTRKITSAMKMVASSKLHHAQVAIENMLPYEEMLEHILKTFLASDAELRSTFLQERPVKRVALIVYSSNSSLCGGFNANVIKEMQKTLDQYEHLGKDNIIVYPIGRKVAEKVTKLGFKSAGNFVALADKPNVDGCISIAQELGAMYAKGEVDRVEMIYHHFKSAGSQILTHKTFLPIDIESELNADKERDLTSNVATREAVEYLRNRDRQQGCQGAPGRQASQRQLHRGARSPFGAQQARSEAGTPDALHRIARLRCIRARRPYGCHADGYR